MKVVTGLFVSIAIPLVLSGWGQLTSASETARNATSAHRAPAEEDHDHDAHEKKSHAADVKTSKKPHQHDEHEESSDPKKGHSDEHSDEKAEADEHGHAHGGDEHGEEGHGDHEEEEGSARFGPNKALTAANKKDGIQLSEKAFKALGLSHVTVTGDGTFRLPLKSAVYFQDEVGIYRFKKGWHKLIEVELISKSATEVVVKTSEIHSGDQVAKDGVPLLRAAELEAWGGSGDGHGH